MDDGWMDTFFLRVARAYRAGKTRQDISFGYFFSATLIMRLHHRTESTFKVYFKSLYASCYLIVQV